MRGNSEEYEIQVYLHGESDIALLVGEDQTSLSKKTWLPKSQVEEINRKRGGARDLVTLLVPAWLLTKKELDHLV